VQNRVYVDTNIIIDLCDTSRKTHSFSVNLIEKFIQEEVELFINSDSLSNLFYILKNRSKLSLTEVLEKMRYVTTIFSLVSIEMQDVKEAIQLCHDSNIVYDDYEDMMQYICAKKINANLIVTNDKNFVSLDIEVLKRC